MGQAQYEPISVGITLGRRHVVARQHFYRLDDLDTSPRHALAASLFHPQQSHEVILILLLVLDVWNTLTVFPLFPRNGFSD